MVTYGSVHSNDEACNHSNISLVFSTGQTISNNSRLLHEIWTVWTSTNVPFWCPWCVGFPLETLHLCFLWLHARTHTCTLNATNTCSYRPALQCNWDYQLAKTPLCAYVRVSITHYLPQFCHSDTSYCGDVIHHTFWSALCEFCSANLQLNK
jgi:hypothetical protein